MYQCTNGEVGLRSSPLGRTLCSVPTERSFGSTHCFHPIEGCGLPKIGFLLLGERNANTNDICTVRIAFSELRNIIDHHPCTLVHCFNVVKFVDLKDFDLRPQNVFAFP